MDRYKTIQPVLITLDSGAQLYLATIGCIIEVEGGEIYVIGDDGKRHLTIDGSLWLGFCLKTKKIEKI